MSAQVKATVLALLVTSCFAPLWPAARSAPPARQTPGPSHDYPVQPVPFTAVHLDDVFWAPRIETNRTVSVPFAFEQCELSGRVENFVEAAKALRGEEIVNRKLPGYPFDDTDVYKVIEGASYTLSVHPDPKLDAYVDSLIAKIGAAQESDGYLYTARTIDPQHPHPWAGKERWVLEKVDSHELYDLGHLYEAAVAHYQATGKRTLLDIALRSADLLTRTFGPGKKSIWPGHQITEMGLVKLYRVTGREPYLELAKFMLDERGPDGSQGAGRNYNQSQARIVDQTEAVGHAVRATYMYSGIADIAALTGDAAYLRTSDTIWGNLVAKKLYITGGIGATGRGEAFGGDYEMPNMTAYNETCAAVGNDFWNQRLFLLHADAKYIDVMERTLYNGLLSGVSLDGKAFFYPNPLESAGQHARSPWFGVACCPGNITRFMASVPGYAYAKSGSTIYVNLFAAGTADVRLDDGRQVTLRQETRYPWDGRVRLTVTPDRAGAFTIDVRIPGWARNEPVPSDLYRFLDRVDRRSGREGQRRPDAARARQGLRPAPPRVAARRHHRPHAADAGPPHRRERSRRGRPRPRGPAARPDRVRGRVARQPGRPRAQPGAPRFVGARRRVPPGLLGGVTVITGRAFALAYDAAGKVAKTSQPFTAIPYYAWANRGRGEMLVWIPRVESVCPADAVADGRDDERRHRVRQEPAESEDDQRRRGAVLVEPTRRRTSTGGRPRAPASGSSTRSRSRPPCRRSRSTGSTTPAAARSACRRPGASSTATATRGSP